MTDIKTFIITALPTVPAFLQAVENPSKSSVITTFLLPVFFFIISKTVDVCLQLYFKRKK